MHQSSKERMKEFRDKYLDKNKPLKILDIGSLYVNDCYRPLFSPGWEYYGADIKEGKNVDIVLKDGYMWNIENESFDVVISGQVIEHVEDLKRWIVEFSRVVKKNGLICIIGPCSWPYHKAPVDCWRILPDGIRWLLEDIAKLKIKEILLRPPDCIGIAQKIT